MRAMSEAHAELALLVHALRARVRARMRAGQRKVPAPPARPAPAPSVSPRAEAPPPSGTRASRATPPAAWLDSRPAAPSAAPASPARTAAEIAAREVAGRAAACTGLDDLRNGVSECTACGLCRTRTQTVFSDGNGRAGVMFVGEAPGEQEDLSGVPFVGPAGKLLSDIITKGMGLAREEVYIANVLKCRPPGNRDPSELEKLVCTGWLDRQIELVNPRVIVPLGRHAACHVLGVERSMGALRGRVHERGGRKVVPTYHPAYLLRSPGMKRACWEDIQLAMRELGLAPRGGA
jgi:DNA polymerase